MTKFRKIPSNILVDFRPILSDEVERTIISSKQWIFKTYCPINRRMKKNLKNLQKSAKNALQKIFNGLLYASCRKQ